MRCSLLAEQTVDSQYETVANNIIDAAGWGHLQQNLFFEGTHDPHRIPVNNRRQRRKARKQQAGLPGY
jgi:hypothetical protein